MQKQKLPAAYAAPLAEYGLSGVDLSGASLILYEPGEWFFREGRQIESLCVILSGKAKVCVGAADGRSLLLCYYVSEGIVGDVELMTGKREAISSMQAVTPLTCAAFPLALYAQVLRAHLPFVLRVGAGLAEKLEARVKSSAEIILRPFEARLCAYLLQSAQGGMFSERLTDVSEQLGVSYRHLLRMLRQLVEAGVLEKRRGGYAVADERALQERAAK